MQIARSILLWLSGTVSGIGLVLSCGDNLNVRADASTAVDAPKVIDAVPACDCPACDCPAAEPPLAGRFVTISNTSTIAAGGLSAESAGCPMGSQPISGSCTQNLLNPYRHLTLEQSGFHEAYPTEWWCWFRNNESTPVTIRASIICLKPAP